MEFKPKVEDGADTVMEGPEAAYAQGDLYADVMAGPTQNATNGQEATARPAVEPVVNKGMEYKSYTTIHPKSMEQQEKEMKISANIDKTVRGKQLYVGGLTWWTTDEELSTVITECGVTDLISIKFFENRVNGQSKGFALVEVGSETSQRLVAERLPTQTLHDQKPIITFVNKQALQMFENQAKKDNKRQDFPQKIGNFGEKREDKKPKPIAPPAGPQFISGFPPPGANVVAAPMMDPNLIPQAMPFPPAGVPPGSVIVDPMGNVIQGMPGMNGPPQIMPPGFPPNANAGHMHPLPPRPGIAPHINPAFIPPPDGIQPVDPVTGAPLQTAGMNEQDMESMRRNQAVASTAIQRAMTDANAGEFESGIETLVTAISLIKQSTTANSEPAQVLVQSLQDCLQGLEGQLVQKGSGSQRQRHNSDYARGGGGGGGGGDHDRDRRRRRGRSRSRSRERSRERRSRSRSRERRDRRR